MKTGSSYNNIDSFIPPKRVLMGPGPSDVHPRVLAAMARPTIGHLDPAFVEMMEQLKTLLRYAFQTENAITFPVSGPGSVGMETCFVNLVEPGDKVVVCRNGVFGGRMIENVRRCGGSAIVVDDAWGSAVDPNKLEDALHANPDAKLVAFVHAETSTGAQSDAKTLADIARRHDCLTIADTVTSLGGTPVNIDAWGVDAVYAGSQKCLSCTPGLSPVSFSERAIDAVKRRKTPCQSWFMDLNLIVNYWNAGKRTYHHTAPINPLYGLHEALVMLKEEGLENAWARHKLHHRALKAGIEAMGLRFFVDEKQRLPQLNAVTLPHGVDDEQTRQRLLNDYGLEIGAGLGDMAGKIWRIGLMGHGSRQENVMLCLRALDEVLGAAGADIKTGAAETAARRFYLEGERNS